MKSFKTLFLFGAIPLLFSACVFYTSTDYSGSDNTAGAVLSGTLVDPQGNPVANAQMKAFSITTASSSLSKTTASTDTDLAIDTNSNQIPADSAWTDAKGQFKFSHLKQGSYNVEGSAVRGGQKLVVCHQEIHLGNSPQTNRDTLRTPGSITVEVQSSNIPLNGVQCSVVGTSFFAMSDDSGKCFFNNVPPGIFRVRMQQSGFLSVTSNAVLVQSGLLSDAGTWNLPVDTLLQSFSVQNSTVALWTFNSQSGGQFTDSSSHHNVLTGSGGYTLQSSPRGSAIVFDGTNGILSVSNNGAFTVGPTGIITFEARIYLDQYPSTANFGGGGHLMGTYEGLAIGIASDGSFGAGTQKYNSGTGNYWYKAGQSDPGVIPLHHWVNIAVAMDQTVSPSQLYAYIDGKPVQLYGIPNTDPVRISTSNWTVGNSDVDNDPFKGKIDEIRVSNALVLGAGFPLKPISPVDRISHFDVAPSTIALWTFNSFHNNMVSDIGPNNLPLVSTNGHNGVVDASLLSASPNGSSITFTDASNPLVVADGSKMISITGDGVVPSSASSVPILTFATTGQLTFEARIYLDHYPDPRTSTHGQYCVLGMYEGLKMTIDSAGRFYAATQKTGSNGNYWYALSSGSTVVPLHRWVDVAVALDRSSGELYGYLDEQPVRLSGDVNSDPFRVSTSVFTVGKDNVDGQAFKGLIDEIRVSNNLVLGAGLPLNGPIYGP